MSLLRKIGYFCAALLISSCGPDDVLPVDTDIIGNATEANGWMEDKLYTEFYTRSLFLNACLVIPLLYSDNCVYMGNENDNWQSASDFDIQPDNALNLTMFTDFYSINGNFTELFGQLDTSFHETLTDEVKDGFRAEARAFRAVLYYYLNAYWGNVPILLENTETVDSLIPNATAQELFDLIESDLLFAAEHISKNTYVSPVHRLDATAVNALLARFYLQHGRWSEALQYASDVLTSGDVGLEEGMDEVFTAGSSENIWILEEDVQGLSIALYFLQPFSNGLYVVRPRDPIGFDMGDARRNVSISASGNTIIKYTGIFSNNDPLYLMRLPEVYLIAAEAAIMANNDFEAAAEYLNALRERAGLAEVILNAGNYEALLAHERNAELCYEGFHRFMDLKRWGQDQEVLGPYGYEERDALWPIPQLFLDVFKSVEQNPGY